MKEIPLSKGYVALVDDGDYEALSRHKWKTDVQPRSAYAFRMVKGSRRLMHREIMAAQKGEEVDHIHHPAGEVIDNRRENLRLVTLAQNRRNRRKRADCSSPFKGVARRVKRWRAHIKVNDSTISLGSFVVEGYAALAYDLAAVKYFGEHALTNFPVPGSTVAMFDGLRPDALSKGGKA